ncbi:MAG: IgGFc-binding protein [Acidobacteriota bacterium]
MRTLAICLAMVAACGPSDRNPGGGGSDANPGDCVEGSFQCSGPTWQVCQGGMWTTSVECPTACADGIGCVQCAPGQNTCVNGDVATCDASGNPGAVTMQCTGSTVCSNGSCVDACMDAAATRSYVGCEYWAVDLDNALEVVDTQANGTLITPCDLYTGATATTMNVCNNGSAVSGLCDPPGNSCPSGYSCSSMAVCVYDAEHSPFGIVVSNPQSKNVDVTVTAGDGTSFTTSVAAGAVQALMPQSHAIADQSVDLTGDQKKAYKVTSTLPIVAYQFNPLDNVNVFSNDASLLIPRTAWDVDYYGMAWPTADNRAAPAPNLQDWYGYLAIVSYQDGTVVEVTPTAAIQASATQTSIAAGTPTMFTLNAFDVLNLEAVGGGDLTGTTIHSMNGTTPIGVFGGHEAMELAEATPPSNCPGCSPCCADHLEEMLFPNSTWGKTFAIARSKQRLNEPDYIRVMAQKPSTSVTFTPAATSVAGNCASLGPGQFCDVKIQGDTAITASEPVLVGQYLESAIWSDGLFNMVDGGGDPSMAIAVPVEQYRTNYTILIPSSYMNNYLSISAPPTGAVLVDGNTQTLSNFANNTYRSTIVTVMAGQHTIQCPGTCGVLVYGYSDAVSYMFAGGLDLKQIVVQ